MMYGQKTIAIPPGHTIREQLVTREMSQKEFAARMDMTEKHISQLINGKVALTQAVALRLESVIGIPAHFWCNLETLYREKEARIREEGLFIYDEEIAQKMPYAACAKLGWLPQTRKLNEKVYNLRAFFEVANLRALESLRIPGINYRKTNTSASSDYALAMWAQQARILARNAHTEPIDIKKLKRVIPRIRSLSTTEPSFFSQELEGLFSACGIALVLLPHLSGSFLHGATFIDGSHIVLGLTVRGKFADKFWFSLFHELGHIMKGHINSNLDIGDSSETEADEFAQNTLIPPKEYGEFLEKHNYSQSEIIFFSSSIGVAPGIVLGRLQRENHVPYNRLNALKMKYSLTE